MIYLCREIRAKRSVLLIARFLQRVDAMDDSQGSGPIRCEYGLSNRGANSVRIKLHRAAKLSVFQFQNDKAEYEELRLDIDFWSNSLLGGPEP